MTSSRISLALGFGLLLGAASCSHTPPAPAPAPAPVPPPARPTRSAAVPQYPVTPRINPASPLPAAPPAGVKISYSSVNTTAKVLAMTFDDGPHPTLTPKLLDLMRERNVKCTFFVIGKNARAYPQIIRRMIAEGHEVANHTWNHPSLTSLSDAQIRQELRSSEEAVMAAANYRLQLIRPPYGAVNTRIKQLMFAEFGYSTIMWSVDPQDWRRPGASVVTQRLVSGAHPGAIMLAHDIHPSTIEAMPAMFDQLIAQGYQFVTVGQLLNLEKTGATAALSR